MELFSRAAADAPRRCPAHAVRFPRGYADAIKPADHRHPKPKLFICGGGVHNGNLYRAGGSASWLAVGLPMRWVCIPDLGQAIAFTGWPEVSRWPSRKSLSCHRRRSSAILVYLCAQLANPINKTSASTMAPHVSLNSTCRLQLAGTNSRQHRQPLLPTHNGRLSLILIMLRWHSFIASFSFILINSKCVFFSPLLFITAYKVTLNTPAASIFTQPLAAAPLR